MVRRALSVVALAASLSPAAAGAGRGKVWPPRVGQPVPAETVTTVDGREIAFEKLRGKAVWIAFFHST
jgi:hypothetical protein